MRHDLRGFTGHDWNVCKCIGEDPTSGLFLCTGSRIWARCATKMMRKPGYMSPGKPQATPANSFSQQLIGALEEAQANSDRRDAHPSSAMARAQETYEKLQYDFPVLPAPASGPPVSHL